VVLIVVDTLRADHLSHYGYGRDTAAPLDAFRAKSTLFTRAYSTAPWTGPATMSILTGLSPLQHRGTRHGDVLSAQVVTLAERLDAAGYTTHGISFNSEVSRQTGYAQGFDVFDDFLGDAIDYPDIQQMVRRTAAWLASEPPEPFFLYLQPMNVHGPYRVPKSRRASFLGYEPGRAFEYYGRDLMAPLMREGRVELRARVGEEVVSSLVDQYDVAVRYSVEEIARILAALETAGALDSSLVVITSDHGEELFDHGGFSHGFTLHREVLHVPLYVHLPGQSKPDSIDRPVSLLDLTPTILARAGIPTSRDVGQGPATAEPTTGPMQPTEPSRDLEGIDLFSAAARAAEPRALVQHAGWTERAEGLSLILDRDHLIDLEHRYDDPDARVALYDLEGDPAEQKDRSIDERKETERLRALLEAEAGRLVKKSAYPEPKNVLDSLDDEATARLRALGYVE
jgi:arylsulfatase A-like enzyme